MSDNGQTIQYRDATTVMFSMLEYFDHMYLVEKRDATEGGKVLAAINHFHHNLMPLSKSGPMSRLL
eukprot:5496966-Karenia_brevis.AAC.1